MNNEEKILELLVKMSGQIETIQEQNNEICHRLDAVEHRLDVLEQKVDALEQKVDSLERRIGSLEQRMNSVETTIETMQGQINGLQLQVTKNRKEMHERFDLMKPLVDYAWDEIDLVDRKLNKKIAMHEYEFHSIPLPEGLFESSSS